MTFIDWSDSAGMFGLLVDFIADERAEEHHDPERSRFLADLLAQLRAVEDRVATASSTNLLQALEDIHESAPSQLADDPVMTHLQDCIVELQRVESEDA